ncbi:uncharacterized protein BJX67DRAFT_353161, partial [Aspergillus lucknowensis]
MSAISSPATQYITCSTHIPPHILYLAHLIHACVTVRMILEKGVFDYLLQQSSRSLVIVSPGAVVGSWPFSLLASL